MLKALIRKQFREMTAFLTRSQKKGKRRTGTSLVLYILLLLYAYGAFGFMFYTMADSLCAPLFEGALGWLYFALMGTMAVFFGVVGSIFFTYSALYQSKDNDLLLAMPIPPSAILFVRMLGVFGTSLLFEALVLLPTFLVYFLNIGFSVSSLVIFLVLLLILPLLTVTLSCILGWLLGLVTSRLGGKVKSFATVVLTLAFIVVYYTIYSRLYTYLQSILLNSDSVSRKVRIYLYPMYRMGEGASGDWLSLGIFVLMTLAVFALVYRLLSRSFVSIVTRRRGAAKAAYREKTVRVSGIGRALLRKERIRLFGTPTYLLNCALGALLLIVGAVAVVIKREALTALFASLPGLDTYLPLILCAAAGMLAGTDTLCTASLSLEGKTLWLMQSLPVTPTQVLRSKLILALLVNGIPALIFTAVAALTLGLDTAVLAACLLMTALYVLAVSLLHLMIGLKMPNLHWTSEAAAVKQGINILAAMLSGWGILLAMAGLYLLLRKALSICVFLLMCSLLLAAACALLTRWLRKKGPAIFTALG